MQKLILLIVLICISQAIQEKDIQINNKQVSSEDQDCENAFATQKWDNQKWACLDSCQGIEIYQSATVLCYQGDSNYVPAVRCKDEEEENVDYCDYWEGDQFNWEDWQFGCPRNTNYIEVYKSREQNVMALCDNSSLAQVCREGWWDNDSQIIKFGLLTVGLLFAFLL